jgi:hypothetical protein
MLTTFSKRSVSSFCSLVSTGLPLIHKPSVDLDVAPFPQLADFNTLTFQNQPCGATYFNDYTLKEVELQHKSTYVDGACSTHGRDEKRIQYFGWKT